MLGQNEYEMSCYNLDQADIAAQRTLFDIFQAVCHVAFKEVSILDVPRHSSLARLDQYWLGRRQVEW